MPNIIDILARALSLRQETELNSITPNRAGGIMYDTLLVLNQMQLEGGALLISKVYASVAAMEADTTPTSDLTGRALKPGQLVVIVTTDTSSSDMGSEYRYNGPGSWTYVGKVGGLPFDTVPIQNSTKGITSGGVYTALAAMKAEGYKYMGLATPGSGGTAPGTPNQPVFYIAGPGSYPNFGSITVASGYLGFLKYSSGSWTVESVAVGKDYDEQIGQLEAKVDNFVDEVQVQSPNIFNKNDVVDNKAIDYRDGTSFSASGYCYTGRIAIPSDADSIYINKATNSGIRGWACYNANAEYTHGANNTRLITVQPGDAFFRFTLSMSDKDTCMAVVGDSTALPPEYMPYGTITSYKAKDDIIPFDSLVFKTIETGKNRLNPAEVVNDKYIDNQDGTAHSYSAEDPVSITGYIPVSKDGLYFNRYVRFGTAIGAAVYDANKTYIRACYQNYYYQEGDAYVRYTFRTQYLSDAQVEPGNVGTEYEAYTEREVIDPTYIPTPQIDGESGTIKIFLPATIYAVVGDTLQIFYQSLVRSVNVSNYDVRISCSKGKQYHRYFEYTPSSGDVGTNTFRVTVVDDYGNTLGTALCNLVTVASGSSPASAKNVVCVGSSTTANGKWPAECFRRLTGSGGSPSGDGKSNIVFCGNQTKDGAGFVGNSGWGWVDYATSGRPAFRFTIGTTPNVALGNVYSNNGHSYTVIEISDNGTILCSTSSSSNTPQASGTLTKTSGSGDATVAFSASAQDSQNPFWDYTNNKLTFVPFANSYCGGSIDVMYIWLGANGLTNWQTNFATFRGYMETFADTLHTEFPSAKLYLVQGTIPSMKVMMPGYGADGSGYADTFGMVDSFFNLRAFYQEFADDSDYSGFVEYVDGASQFDSDYNFPLTQKAVNTRNNTVTEPYANNTVHPGDPGYMQVADAVYRHFVAKFCQSGPN